MSAVLKPSSPVHAAALERTKADAEVARLKLRLTVIEARAQSTRADRARHQEQVTEALISDGALPRAREPEVIEPDDAVRIVREELKRAEAALADAAGAHRAAIVRHIEHRRDEALAGYQAALVTFTGALTTLAAYDRILSRTQLTNALPPLFHSRLSIPALRGEPEASPGLALDGGNFFAKPDLLERERQARAALTAEVGPLPF